MAIFCETIDSGGATEPMSRAGLFYHYKGADDLTVTTNGTAAYYNYCFFEYTGTTASFNFLNFDMFGIAATVQNCIIDGNGFARGIFINRFDSSEGIQISNNIFYDCDDGIYFDEMPGSVDDRALISRNIFDTMGGYAINYNTGTANAANHTQIQVVNNGYWNVITSFLRAGWTGVDYDNRSLSGSPFDNAAGGDFDLDDTADEGALLRSLGFPINMVFDWANIDYRATFEGGGGGTTIIVVED